MIRGLLLPHELLKTRTSFVHGHDHAGDCLRPESLTGEFSAQRKYLILRHGLQCPSLAHQGAVLLLGWLCIVAKESSGAEFTVVAALPITDIPREVCPRFCNVANTIATYPPGVSGPLPQPADNSLSRL